MSTSIFTGGAVATDMVAKPAGDYVLPPDTGFLYASTAGTVVITFPSGLVETFNAQAGDTLPFQRGTVMGSSSATVRIAKLTAGHHYAK